MSGGTIPTSIGRYQVLERIGRGAMGTVYRGRDPYIGRPVAIKVLHVLDEDLRARFLQEMRSLGTLHHPNVVTIFDCGEDAERPFIVMEFVEGTTLAHVIHGERPLPLPQALDVVSELCTALDYAHERGIVHRDIKPANLMIDAGGRLKVVDFGIARVSVDAATQTGTVIGTPSYMAPEQITGAPIDRRTDIFAVGLVLYELISSRQAFPGDGKTAWQIMHAVVNDVPAPLSTVAPGLSPELERIINRAIEKRPADRYQTLAQMAADIADVQRASVAETRPRPRGVEAVPHPAATTEREPAPTIPRGPTLPPAVPVSSPAAAAPSVLPATDAEGVEAAVDRREARPPSPWPRRVVVEWTLAAVTVIALVAVAWTAMTRQRDAAANDKTTAAPASAGAVPSDAAARQPASPPAAVETPVATQPVASRRDDAPPVDGAGRATAPAAPLPAPAVTGKPVAGPYEQARLLLPPDSRAPNPQRAASLLQRACDSGDWRGCVDLADMAAGGAGIDRDEPRAAALYRRACDGGVGAACDKGGAMYLDGRGVTRDVATAASMLERACEDGSRDGCNRLGVIYTRGIAVSRDEARAATLYDKACAQSLGIACVNLGIAYQNGRGVPKDLTRARTAYNKACDAGYNWGCLDVARLLARGEGGDRDERRAADLFQRACDSGLPEGCNDLGIAYARGAGVERDEVKAAALYQRACDGGTPAGCGNLGGMYRDGRAVPRDDVRAASLFQRACDGNGPPACYALGRALMAGRGVTKNEAAATAAFRKSCDGGHADGCVELAAAYSRGTGVARDDAEAARLYQRACDGGAAVACSALARPSDNGRGSASAGAASGTGPLRAGGAIPMPARVSTVGAVYPAAARVAGVEGTVQLDATVDASGHVVATKVTQSIPLLDDAAETAVRQWQFAPTVVNGAAIPVVVPVSIRFSLRQSP